MDILPIGGGNVPRLVFGVSIQNLPDNFWAATCFGFGFGLILPLSETLRTLALAPMHLARGRRHHPSVKLLSALLCVLIPLACLYMPTGHWTPLPWASSLQDGIILLWPYPLLSAKATGLTLCAYGVLLLLADGAALTVRRIEHLGGPSIFALSLVAFFSFIPGLTIVMLIILALRFWGFEREDSVRFGLLVLWPVLMVQALALIGHTTFDLIDIPGLIVSFTFFAGAAIVSLTAAVALLTWSRSHTLAPLAVCNMLTGGLLAFSGWLLPGLFA